MQMWYPNCLSHVAAVLVVTYHVLAVFCVFVLLRAAVFQVGGFKRGFLLARLLMAISFGTDFVRGFVFVVVQHGPSNHFLYSSQLVKLTAASWCPLVLPVRRLWVCPLSPFGRGHGGSQPLRWRDGGAAQEAKDRCPSLSGESQARSAGGFGQSQGFGPGRRHIRGSVRG